MKAIGVASAALAGEAGVDDDSYRGSAAHEVDRIGASSRVARDEVLPEEVPVALVYNGLSHAVMLATPENLTDFGLGFSLSEGILASPAELYDCETISQAEGIELHLQISTERFAALKAARRSMTGRTGCGLCGVESLRMAIRPLRPVAEELRVSAQAIRRAVAEMPKHQALHRLTHAVHGAAWASREGEIVTVREDVGRHNALDKLLGTLAKGGIDRDLGFVVLSSRASIEMVQKAAALGVQLLVFIATPTGLAIDVAKQAGVTLIGKARGDEFSVYTFPQRVLSSV